MTPLIGEIQPVIDAKGRHRGAKTWIICPCCEQGRWVRADGLRLIEHSGFCKRCHAKFTTGQGEEHSRWKGGKSKSHGYVTAYIRPDDFFFPMVKSNSHHILEHRLIMAKHLNRCLLPWEVVHHRNGIKDDNRLENLELLPGSKYHLVDNCIKRLVVQLQEQIQKLRTENEMLKYK